MKLKIATYNTMHCEDFRKRKINYDSFAKALTDLDADITGLNEIRGKGTWKGYDAQTEILSEKTGLHGFFAKAIDVGHCGNPYGNALLSKLPLRSCEVIPIPDPEVKSGSEPYETRCILKAVTDTEPQITVLVTHFGLNADEARNAVKTVLDNIPGGSCILTGDFNLKPDSDILLPIRERLTDTADFMSGNTLTFPSDKPNRKIDYIFVSKDIRVLSCKVEELVLSDHRPVSAVIEIG